MATSVRFLGADVAVQAPRKDARFIAGVKALGGKWQPQTYEWVVPAENEPKLADLLVEVFGGAGYYPRISLPPRVRYQPLATNMVYGYSLDHALAFVRDLNERRFTVDEDGTVRTRDHWCVARPVDKSEGRGDDFALAFEFTNERRQNGWILADDRPWLQFHVEPKQRRVADAYRWGDFVEEMNKQEVQPVEATLNGRPVTGAVSILKDSYGLPFEGWFLLDTQNAGERALFVPPLKKGGEPVCIGYVRARR